MFRKFSDLSGKFEGNTLTFISTIAFKYKQKQRYQNRMQL